MTSTERRVLRADCVADAEGGITFDVAGAAPDAEFVLKRRGGDGPHDEVSLPLTASGDGKSRAVLTAAAGLAEGRWDAYAGEEAVESGIRDVRALLDRVPDADRVAVRVPYPEADGRLALRCWVRGPHAEAGDVGVAQERGAMTLEGRLYGAELAEGAVAEARLRGDGSQVRRVPVTGEGRTFAFTLPFAALGGEDTGKERLWDLWLLPAEDASGIRIARILDDVWDRRNVYIYPGQQVGAWLATPCYTSENELCVRLTAAP